MARYQERSDDAGRLVRRLAREMTSLGVFLREHGTDSEQRSRWIERSLSLRQTCRQMGRSTFGVLVEAVTCLFQDRQPNLAWLY
jgi:uncharacterized alpha-E superfamily protein